MAPTIHAWKDPVSMAEAARKAAEREQCKDKVQHYLEYQINREEHIIHHPPS